MMIEEARRGFFATLFGGIVGYIGLVTNKPKRIVDVRYHDDKLHPVSYIYDDRPVGWWRNSDGSVTLFEGIFTTNKPTYVKTIDRVVS